MLSGRDPVDDGDVWNAGTLSLSQSTVSGNFAGHYRYGAYFGDGGDVLNTSGTLTLVRTLVSGNSASSWGTEVYHYSGKASAAIIASRLRPPITRRDHSISSTWPDPKPIPESIQLTPWADHPAWPLLVRDARD